MPRGRKTKHLKAGDICKYFKKAADGFCKHYTGSRQMIESCYGKCDKRKA